MSTPANTSASTAASASASTSARSSANTPRALLDVNAFVGSYPYRQIPHPDPEILVCVLDREEIGSAWVGHLAGAFHRDPYPSNAWLHASLLPHRERLIPAPIVRPDWPRWRDAVAHAADAGAKAVRVYPQLWGYGAGDGRLAELAAACGERSLAVLFTVRFEDMRQRSALDTAGDLSAAHVRELARSGTGARLVVTAAGKESIEEVHWSLTPSERELVFYDFSWVWGPPSDELAALFRAVGSDRFVYGTMWPLRLTQGARANLALLPSDLSGHRLADPSAW